MTTLPLSERRACRLVGLGRSTYRYEPRLPDDEPRLLERIKELVREHPRYGYRRIHALLLREGFRVNRKRIYRLWRREGYRVPRRQHKRRRLGTSENACHRLRPEAKDHIWTWDFIFDSDEKGRTLKWLTVLDEYTRECPLIRCGRRMTADDVIHELTTLMKTRGVPRYIRSDNGPEFIAKDLRAWLTKADVGTLYVEPGAPWENGFAESFQSRFRDEFLNEESFANLAEAEALAEIWRREYNEERPHGSLEYLTPAEFGALSAELPVGATPLPEAQPSAHGQWTLTPVGT